MNSELLRVSVLFGTGRENPEVPETLQGMANLKLLTQALAPEAFLAQHQQTTPDLVVVDLDGMTRVPDWLEALINRMPRSGILVCSQCRDPDFLIRLMKLRVGAFVPLPLQRQELEEALGVIRAELAKTRGADSHASQILAVTGTKGGVGVTAIAANLGVALAEQVPGGVVLVDLARPFPHAGQFLDISSNHNIMDLIRHADNLDTDFIHKIVQRHGSHLDVLLGQASFELDTAHFFDTAALGKIFAALRDSYRWIVVDLGSWLDSFFISIIREADQVLLITELTVPDLQNLKRLKGLFRFWNMEDSKVQVLVNRYDKDYTLGLKDLENIFLRPAFATLPSDYPAIIEAINQGLALREVAPRSKLWRGLKKVAVDLMLQNQCKPGAISPPKGLLRRLFR